MLFNAMLTINGTIKLSWTIVSNMLVTLNNLMAQAGSSTAQAQADQILIGDGYIQYKVLDIAESVNAILGLSTSNGLTIWNLFDFGIFYFSVDGLIYSSVSGVNTPYIPVESGDMLRISRVGTEIRFYVIRSSMPMLLQTVTGATTGPLYIKANILDIDKTMLNTEIGH